MNKLLQKIAKKIKHGRELMGSKWQNCEAEVIALQTLSACALNEREHGEALSWLMESATSGRMMDGTNNGRGLDLLVKDGAVVIEPYTGKLKALDGVATEKDKPLVLRCTDELLQYAGEQMGIIKEAA